MDARFEAFDLQRMFLGDASAWFLLEVAFRTTFMFLFTMLLVRTVGKRGLGELTPFELLVIVALGSAVGDPMFYPEVPLLPAMVVVTAIVLLQRIVALIVDHSERAEDFLESTPTRLVADGVVDVDAMRAERFARNELFMLLREHGIEQLGQVKRAYLEPSGRLSTWRFAREDAMPGLPLVPADDPTFPGIMLAGTPATAPAIYACSDCGATRRFQGGETLPSCGVCESADGWMLAITSGDGDGEALARQRGPLRR